MATMTLLEELAPPMIPGNTHNTHIACALCGASVLDQQSAPLRPPPSPTTSAMSRYGTNGSWSTALKNSLPTNFSSRFTTHNNHSSSSFTFEPPTQVYIFRLAATSSSGLPMSLPLGAQQPNGATRPATIYPLCHSGWCLGRLRTTCSLWAFIRTSVVEKVWEEVAIAPPPLPAREVPHSLSVEVNGSNGKTEGTASPGEQKTTDVNQAISPKKSRIGIGSLWGTMSRGLGSTKAPEPEKETEVEKKPVAQGKASVKSPVTSPRRLPPPPPVHPSRTDNHLPPPPQAGAGGAPPPLPKRNRTRPDQAPKRASVSPPNGTDHAEQEERVSEEGRPSTPSLSTTTPPTNGPSSTESQDHFTTPTEELPPSTPGTPTPKPKHASRSVSPSPSPPTPAPVPIPERPMSPHKIPLPTSRPSTPVRVPRTPPPHSPGFSKLSGNEKRRSMSPVKIPSRSGSPAPGAAHISNGGTSSIPGTPPPIPRRAAARTRPVSSSGLASTAGVVLPPPTEPVAEEKKDELEEKTTEAPNEQAPRESEESQEPTMDTQETVENNSDEKLAPVELPPSDEKAELGESAEKTESGDEASPPAYEPSSADGPQPELADKKAPEDPFTTTVDTATSPVIEDPNGGLVTEPENDLGIYVGDSTWEERTFKEVVRLREEMFWARVGGLR